MVVVPPRRRVSACGLPRPSAIASAKLAKTTVNHNQIATASTKSRSATSWLLVKVAVGWVKSKRTNSMVVITLPTSATNIPGFLTCTRGSSFLNDSGIAARMILGSQIEMPPLRRVFHCLTSNVSVGVLVLVRISERSPYVHEQLFDDRPQRVGREVGERANDQDHADHEADEERPRRGEGPQAGGHHPLPDKRAGEGQDGDDLGEAANQHDKPQRPGVKRRVAGKPRTSRAVVAACASAAVQHI